MGVCLLDWGGWVLHGVDRLRFDEAGIDYLLFSFYTIHLVLCRVYFRCNNIKNGIGSIHILFA